MTRCTMCNGALEVAGPDKVVGRVPQRVLSVRNEFYVCQTCGQVYWKGSHWDDIERKLERLIGPRGGSSPR